MSSPIGQYYHSSRIIHDEDERKTDEFSHPDYLHQTTTPPYPLRHHDTDKRASEAALELFEAKESFQVHSPSPYDPLQTASYPLQHPNDGIGKPNSVDKKILKVAFEKLKHLPLIYNNPNPRKQIIEKASHVKESNVERFDTIMFMELNALGLPEDVMHETSIHLCRIYKDQIEHLKEEGMKTLALYICATIFDFLQANQLNLDKPWHKQLMMVLQGQEETWTGPNTVSLAKFGLSVYERLATYDEELIWVAGDFFSHCNIRTDQGEYFANIVWGDKYGFRLGTREEADELRMKEVVDRSQKRDSVDQIMEAIASDQLNGAASDGTSVKKQQLEKFWEDAKERDLYEKREIEQEDYINGHPIMKIFYESIRSKLNSMFISLFALNGGFVEQSRGRLVDLPAKGLQALGSVIPDPITGGAVKASGMSLQIYQGQKKLNRVEKEVEICLDPYIYSSEFK